MKNKRMFAAFLALACVAVGMGAWAVVGQVKLRAANARLEELEAWQTSSEETFDLNVDPEAIAAEFNGGVVTALEAAQEYETISAYYDMLGMDEAEYAEDLKYTVIDALVEEKLLALKAQEAGVYELNEEQLAQIEQRVKTEYEENIEYYMAFRFDESKTDEQVREETIDYLNENGYSYEQMLEEAKQNAWRDLLYEYVTKDMTIGEAELQEFYDSQVTTAEMTYSADFSEYEMDSEGGRAIVWHPEGVRRVEAIQLSFDADQSVEYLSLQAAAENGDAQSQTQLDALYQQLEQQVQTALERVQAGEDFLTVANDYGGAEEISVSDRSTLRGEAFRDAAMSLAEIGDVSGVVRTDGGVCILRYASDVTAGAVPLAEVADELRENYEAEIRSNLYNSTVLAWMEEADIQYHLEQF